MFTPAQRSSGKSESNLFSYENGSYIEVGNEEDFEELSHFIKLSEITTDGFEIVKNALSNFDTKDIFINTMFSY